MNEPTTAEAIAWFEKHKAGVVMLGANAMYDMAINALCAQAEAEKNDPLTLNELREMDGEPIWIIHAQAKQAGGWLILAGYDPDLDVLQVEGGGLIDCAFCGKTWFAYRRKPEEGIE